MFFHSHAMKSLSRETGVEGMAGAEVEVEAPDDLVSLEVLPSSAYSVLMTACASAIAPGSERAWPVTTKKRERS